MDKNNYTFYMAVITCSLMLASGCVSLESEKIIEVKEPTEPVRQGVYHKVKDGETLWQIAEAYGVSVNEIARANNIPTVAKIEDNQLVFVIGATKVLDIGQDSNQSSKQFVWPVQGKVIQHFHERYGNGISKGIGIKAKVGDEVIASRSGRVVFADYLTGYGHTVILDHLDGFHSVYSNNSKLLVNLGDQVLKSSVIAQVGHNRNLAYLHFQIRKKSMEDNPLYYLP